MAKHLENVTKTPINAVIDVGKKPDGTTTVSLPVTAWNAIIGRPKVVSSVSELGSEQFSLLKVGYVDMTREEINRLLGYDAY